MQRYVYCPSEKFLEQANCLSREVSLPVMIGDNSYSSILDFDRTKVCVIKIPEYQNIFIGDNVINVGFHQSIKYTNEYKILKNNVELYINGNKVPSLYEEMHVVKFNFLCTEPGKQSCIINVSNVKEEEFSFDVN